MNIYLLEQDENSGYDTYDGCVVIAENEEEAKQICPSPYHKYNEELNIFHWQCNIGTSKEQFEPNDVCRTWAKTIRNVTITYIGKAKEDSEQGIVLSSFNAG